LRPRLILSRVPLLLQQIGLGVLLGLIQLLLFFLGLSRFGMNLALNLSFIPGLILYLVFPVVAGLLTTHREERASAGARAGFVTGFTGATIVMLALILTLAIIAPQESGNRFYIPLDFTLAFILFTVLMLNVLGVLLATIGGAFGRSMGRGWS
jgi:Family of unknown function (DUF5518)